MLESITPEKMPTLNYKNLVCPNCRASYSVIIEKMTGFTCGKCRESGTIAYFTPGPKIDRRPRLIERTLTVQRERGDAGHVKAVTAALALLVQATNEEALDLRWETLRMSAAADEPRDQTTIVVVIQAIPRAPHDPGAFEKLLRADELREVLGFEANQRQVETIGAVLAGEQMRMK